MKKVLRIMLIMLIVVMSQTTVVEIGTYAEEPDYPIVHIISNTLSATAMQN